jgi:transcriptional regulator with XRE-family HTH domain/quercetin dioxygenase-like cupin family protein
VSTQPDPPIGQRIREERLRRGFNLRSLARAVNVSASHISQIETGKCRPSVSTLYAITTALGVSIDDIFDGSGVGLTDLADTDLADTEIAHADLAMVAGDLARPTAVAVPHGTAGHPAVGRRGTVAPSAGAAAALVALASEHARRIGPVVGPADREMLELDSGVTWERLGHVPGLQVDFLLITYAPGGSSSSTAQLMRHQGTEYGYLISGELIVTLGFSEHKVVAGDAICFPSSTPHRYRNEGPEQAVGVWFVANPD